jgi:hypothetical protein
VAALPADLLPSAAMSRRRLCRRGTGGCVRRGCGGWSVRVGVPARDKRGNGNPAARRDQESEESSRLHGPDGTTARHARTATVARRTRPSFSRIVTCAAALPLLEAVVARLIRRVTAPEIRPRRSRAKDPQDPVEHVPGSLHGRPPRAVGPSRSGSGMLLRIASPLLVGEIHRRRYRRKVVGCALEETSLQWAAAVLRHRCVWHVTTWWRLPSWRETEGERNPRSRCHLRRGALVLGLPAPRGGRLHAPATEERS